MNTNIHSTTGTQPNIGLLASGAKTPAVKQVKKTTFSARYVETVSVNVGSISPHPFMLHLGLTNDESIKETIDFLAAESKLMNHYNTICVTRDMKVITQFETYEAAKQNGSHQMLKVDIIDIDEDDLVRFINAKSVFFRRNYKARWALLETVRKYMDSGEKGQAWKIEYGSDINVALAKVTGYGRTTVKQFQAIGRYANAHPSEMVWDNVGEGKRFPTLDALEIHAKAHENKPLSNDGHSEFPLSVKDETERVQKQLMSTSKFKKQNERAEKMQGTEPVQFSLKWGKEGKMLTGRATESAYVRGKKDSATRRKYEYKVDGVTIATFIINIPEAFERSIVNPLIKKS